MNLYLVISENVRDCAFQPGGMGEPPEARCICEAVAAETPAQAKYLAWRNDTNSGGGIDEMPRFLCQIRGKGAPYPKGVLRDSDVPDCFDWRTNKERAEFPDDTPFNRSELRAEAIEAALRDVLAHFEDFGPYVVPRGEPVMSVMPKAAAEAIRAAWATLGEPPPHDPT